jgi:hypothetical protein
VEVPSDDIWQQQREASPTSGCFIFGVRLPKPVLFRKVIPADVGQLPPRVHNPNSFHHRRHTYPDIPALFDTRQQELLDDLQCLDPRSMLDGFANPEESLDVGDIL